MRLFIAVNGITREVRKLTSPEGTVAFSLIGRRGGRDSQVICFDLGTGGAACTCAHGCTAFAECCHARALRRACRELAGLPLRREERFFAYSNPADWAQASEELQRQDAGLRAGARVA